MKAKTLAEVIIEHCEANGIEYIDVPIKERDPKNYEGLPELRARAVKMRDDLVEYKRRLDSE